LFCFELFPVFIVFEIRSTRDSKKQPTNTQMNRVFNIGIFITTLNLLMCRIIAIDSTGFLSCLTNAPQPDDCYPRNFLPDERHTPFFDHDGDRDSSMFPWSATSNDWGTVDWIEPDRARARAEYLWLLISLIPFIVTYLLLYIYHLKCGPTNGNIIQQQQFVLKPPTKEDEDEDNNNKKMAYQSSSDDCTICSAKFNDARQLPCGHVYCNACINEWWTKSRQPRKQCPICKQEFLTLTKQLPKPNFQKSLPTTPMSKSIKDTCGEEKNGHEYG
jgi:hypothetical protein